MPKSIVEPKLEITETKWIVSAINSDGSLEGVTFGGHAMIVVEGIYKETPSSLHFTSFIGQYDILAATTDEDEKDESNGFPLIMIISLPLLPWACASPKEVMKVMKIARRNKVE